MSYSESERRLTNDDFRKLFMTPRHPGDAGSSSSSSMAPPPTPQSSSGGSGGRDKDRDERRKKKKHFYAKIKKEEDDQMAELARKYRDRAKERRDGLLPEQQREDLISSQGAYRAMAPDFRANVDAAERRKQLIQESKFLGGDMEHTHLVKGLDYALLQKVRSELDTLGEGEDEDEIIEKIVEAKKPEAPAPVAPKAKEKIPVPSAPETLESGFRSKLGRNIHRVLFKSSVPERNELFAPGRMAFVMDLEEEYAESDIPTTLIRSKQDVPNAEGQATLTTNDIVINKLAQILSYLRQGSKSSKKHKKKETKSGKHEEKASTSRKNEDDSIFGDIGDYTAPTKSSSSSKSRSKHEEKDRSSGSSKKHTYFAKPAADDDERDDDEHGERGRSGTDAKKRDRETWIEDSDKPKQSGQTFGSILKKGDEKLSKSQKLLSKFNAQPEGYAECYPGFEEMHDAMDDSDEETDYSKMDPGKKKGAVGRWDFDSVEEYSEYMSNKEALPKAAFQFGVKMGDGRKTRKGAKSEKNEKAQLDRQWQQIQAIMHKRKGGSGDGGEPEPKTPRM